MNKITKRAIVKASLTNFELVAFAGVVVITADMLWLAHDIVTNGFNAWYGVIGSLMVSGFLSTIAVIVRHNRALSTKYAHSMLEEALDHQKRKAKSKKGGK